MWWMPNFISRNPVYSRRVQMIELISFEAFLQISKSPAFFQVEDNFHVIKLNFDFDNWYSLYFDIAISIFGANG